MDSGGRRGRRSGTWLSLVFASLAVVLAVVAVLYLRGDDGADRAPTPPPAPPGRNEMIHVANALREQGLDVQFAPGGVPAGELSVPGQVLAVDGARLYVFIYPDPAQAEAEAGRVDPSVVLSRGSSAGSPVAAEPPLLASHSNVTVALVGGSAELAETIERAINNLP